LPKHFAAPVQTEKGLTAFGIAPENMFSGTGVAKISVRDFDSSIALTTGYTKNFETTIKMVHFSR